MIEIYRNRVNNIMLGIPKSKLQKEDFVTSFKENLFLEFDTSKEYTLITISVKNHGQFLYDRLVVNFKNIQSFIAKNNHFLDSTNTYTFPEIRLSLIIDFTENIFLEILVFDKSISKNYTDNQGTFVSFSEDIIEKATFLKIDPYKPIGVLYFGKSKKNILSMFNIKGSGYLGVNSSEIYHLHNIILRFDNDIFTQIYMENIPIQQKIILENMQINLQPNLIMLERNNTTLMNHNYTVFPELGITIHEDSFKGKFHMYFFDKSLLHFWENSKRPITSW